MASNDEAAAVWVSVDDLTPWADNPRRNEAAIPEVMASIRRFGFAAPIVARHADGEVIAGHTRLEAARRLGLDRVPVRYMDLDPVDAHLLGLADNKVGEIASWDDAKLAGVLADLDVGEDTEGLGFSNQELDGIIGPTPEPPPIKEWSASDLKPPEQIVVVINAEFSDRHKIEEALGAFDVDRVFMSFAGAVKW